MLPVGSTYITESIGVGTAVNEGARVVEGVGEASVHEVDVLVQR